MKQEKTCRIVRLSYGAALSLMTVITGVLFIWQTLDIYLNGGNRPFTSEIVAERLSMISPAFWIWIAMIIIGFVVWEVFPVQQKRTPLKDDCYALKRLNKRMPSCVGEAELPSLNFIKKERKILLIVKICTAVVCLACAIYSLVYLATPSHFPKTDVTHEILNMAANVLPCAVISLLILCGVAFYEAVSAKKQLPHAKKLVASAKTLNAEQAVYSTQCGCPVNTAYAKFKSVVSHKYFVLGVRIAIACLAVAFIIAGIFNDNMRNILIKAINICTECIGLG